MFPSSVCSLLESHSSISYYIISLSCSEAIVNVSKDVTCVISLFSETSCGRGQWGRELDQSHTALYQLKKRKISKVLCCSRQEQKRNVQVWRKGPSLKEIRNRRGSFNLKTIEFHRGERNRWPIWLQKRGRTSLSLLSVNWINCSWSNSFLHTLIRILNLLVYTFQCTKHSP